MKVYVASKNPIKCAAAKQGVTLMFPDAAVAAQGFSAASGVSDQPMTCGETRLGAFNRVKNLIAAQPGADLYIGLEGGCEETTDVLGNPQLEAFAWAVISDGKGKWGESRATGFYLPPQVAALVRQGIELGEADDRVFGQQNSKESMGASGLLTGGAVDRAQYYMPMVVMALVPFKNTNLY